MADTSSQEPRRDSPRIAPPSGEVGAPGAQENRGGRSDVAIPELEAMLRQLGLDPNNPETFKAISSLSMTFGGPLPAPWMLEQYNRVIPGLGDKLIGWTEKQQNHRMSLERDVNEKIQHRMDRGQFIAGSVAVVGLLAAAVVGIWGSAWAAAVIAAVAVGGPTAAVAFTRFGRKAEGEPE